MSFIILLAVVMASGATEEVRLEVRYDSMSACEAAMSEAEQAFKREHPDVRVEKVECRQL